jgi:alanyl-tRNA synthetase
VTETRRLYEADAFLFELDATVVRREAAAGGEEVVLDRTVFFAPSGGQAHDTGEIEGVRVVGVVRRGGEIIHQLAAPLPAGAAPGARVRGRIDVARRLDHMRQHHGQHLLSAAFVETAGAETASVHFGAETSTLDLTKLVNEDQIRAAAARANAVVLEDREVRVHEVSRDELARYRLRREPGVEADTLRLVEVEGFDTTPCSGTHPRRTGQVGPIAVVGSLEKVKTGLRLTFVCGERALRDHAEKDRILTRLARDLSATPSQVGALVEKVRASEKELRTRLRAAETAQAAHEAQALDAASAPGPVARVLAPGSSEELAGALAAALVERGRSVVLGLDMGDRAALVVAVPKGARVGAGAALQEALPLLEGKGGGSPVFAKGAGPRREALVGAVERARAVLESGMTP